MEKAVCLDNDGQEIARVQEPVYHPSPPMQRDAEGWAAMEREIAGLRKSLAAVWHELRWIRRRV